MKKFKTNAMIEFGNVFYSIDLDAYENAIKIKDSDPTESVTKTCLNSDGDVVSKEILETKKERTLEVDSTKYELIRALLEVVLDDVEDDMDDSLGSDRALAKRPLSYRIAFNTLLTYGILKEQDEEE
jgi:hypothetical protein